MERHANLNRNCHPIHSPVPGFRFAVATFACAMLFASPIHAAPDGGQVSAGTGSIAQTGTTTTITQQSQNLAIDWNSFSIAAGESVNFIQPNSTSIALNRILGTSPSEIFGSLSANGQVFILNPNGVLFGQGAQVNVGGLVASTLGLSNADFLAGNYRFSNDGNAGAVVNQGTLTAADGGYIALLAAEVRNEGVISARLGTALLAAGDKVTLNLDNGSLLGYSVELGALNALAENRHLIQADGGQVFMSAKAADALGTAVVNNTGIIEARTVQNIGGVIKLMGDMQVGQINVGGTLDASAPDGGDGGFIETSAAHVNVANDARVTTLAAQGANGTWLIDPLDYTISATGGNISGATLGANLGLGNVVITNAPGTGNGDILVNDAVSWTANTMLTLSAARNIDINANITASGATAGLTLTPGAGGAYSLGKGASITLSGATPTLIISGLTYTVINSLGVVNDFSGNTLQGINGNLSGNYALGTNIDASLTSGWDTGSGFVPIGNIISNFTGNFDGLGHTINNLSINRPTTSNIGLFGYTATGSSIRNVGVLNSSVTGASEVGGLVGYNSGSISNAYTTGNVTSSNNVAGGLVGYNNGTVTKSYSTSNVSGSNYIGGLVGLNYGNLSSVFATGNVNGASFVGGLVGVNTGATISDSYATGSVSGSNAGGLVGQNDNRTIFDINGQDIGTAIGTINKSYASGTVTGSSYNGGLTGINYGAISNSYAVGNVIGGIWVGGLTGLNGTTSATISNSYAAGSVSGTAYAAGFAGNNTGTISASYWNTTTSLQANGIAVGTLTGVTGLTSPQMMTMSNFSGWNIASTGGAGKVWRIYEGYTAPLLTSLLIPQVTVTASDAVKTYDGNVYTGGNGVSYSDVNAVTNGNIFDSNIAYGGTSQNAKNAGSYSITVSGLYSNQLGYDTINYAPGTLTVSPFVVNLSGGRIYDGTNIISSADLGISTPLFGSDNLTLSGSGLMADKHVDLGGKAITDLDSLVLVGSTASNYTLVGGAHSVDVTPAPLTISAGPDSKTYDGTTASAGVVSVAGTLYDNDSVTGATQAFNDKNVNTGGSTLIVTGYTINDGNGGANYFVTENTAPGTIAPAALTITAKDNGKVLNDTEPNLYTTGVSYSGFVIGENEAVLGGTLNLTRSGVGLAAPTVNDPAGTYSINASGLSSGNYAITYAPGVFTIASLNQLLIVMGNSSAVYGDDPASLLFSPIYAKYTTDGATFNDLLTGATTLGNTWTLGDGQTSFTASTDYTLGGNIGNYAINAGTVTTINPNINPSQTISTPGTLTIDPATLTISAIAATKTYGDPDPALTYSVSGLMFTDALTGSLSRATGENFGSYAINQGTLAANSNYTINYTGNNLSIEKAPLSILVNNSTKTYGQTATFAGYTPYGLKFGETIGSVTLASSGAAPTAPVNSGVPYLITSGSASGGTFTATNYIITYGTGQLTVTPAPLTVTANPATKNYDGMPYSGGNGVVYSGLVNGELSTVLGGTLTYGGNSQGATIPGIYQITPGGLTSGNYSISYVSGALTINGTNPAAVALGGDALVLAYNTAQQGIANAGARETRNQPGSNVEPIGIVGCGVTMPPDAPANTCQN